MKPQLHLVAALLVLGLTQVTVRGTENGQAAIVIPAGASFAEALAGREVRRYVYLRTGSLLPLISETDRLSANTVVLIGRKNRSVLSSLLGASATAQELPPQGYWIKNLDGKPAPGRWKHRKVLLIMGGDDAGVLYGAYRFAQLLGVRFYLHGDVVPDEKIGFKLPTVEEHSTPLFSIRGIQPFHDFPEGPDWWNRDDYLAIIGQLPKLRMNFIGLHTYPEGRPNAEPTVWIGPESEIGSAGRLKTSYPASYQNTLRGNWGYTAKSTSKFAFGASALFDQDAFGPEVMGGHLPAPTAPADCNEVFDNTAAMLRDAFSLAHLLSVKTCVGTETPLIVPKLLKERLTASGKNPADMETVRKIYAGIFCRAAAAYPLDYYWLWTPEGWTWSGTKDEEVRATTNDLFAAIAAHRSVQPPFGLATCGWVLGPQQDRALFDKALPKEIAVSCINREVGKTPVEPGFADVHGRSKWAIPWMEDDPALTSPQLWVGRMRRDAADALRYGCDGLLGIHWRTRMLAPNVAALAQAGWQQQPWVEEYRARAPFDQPTSHAGPVGGNHAAFPNNSIAGTEDPVLYQTVRYNVSAYHLPATNGTCRVTLKFSEPHYGEAGKRVFDVKLQGDLVITNLDIFERVGKNQALDLRFDDVPVTNGWVAIIFIPRVEYPSIAAIDIEGANFKTRVNCGGPAYRDYAADAPPSDATRQVYAETADFYVDWAGHEFGSETASAAAAIFSRIDCHLPVPSVWTDGPGGIQPDNRAWQEVKAAYDFVDEYAALRPRVKGAGNLARFDYWLNTFEYLRAIAEVNCGWGEFNRAMEQVKACANPATRKSMARDRAVPARRVLVRLLENLYDHLLATVSTTGELGTVANWEQHNLPVVLERPGEELAKILEEQLGPDLLPRADYRGPIRIIMPTQLSSMAAGATLNLRVLILSQSAPRTASLFYRKLGSGAFANTPLEHVGRGVYRVELKWDGKADLEYFCKVEPATGSPVLYPPTAPRLNQTVVMYGGR